MPLSGRRALITGASSGIGRACAIRLAHDGADVAVNYFSDREADAAAEVVAEVEKAGRRGIAVRADVGAEADVRAMAARTVDELGGLEILVNNAGIENQVATIDLPLADWERVLRTNLTGTFLCMREAARHMRDAGGGVVVNMSSVHQFIPWPGFAHYCASKGGIKMLAETVAREWAPFGIRVVNVAPGAIATPINQGVLSDPEQKEAIEAEVPLGRFGTAEEIAAAVAWIASDEASYVTGTTMVVDGGMALYPKFV
jgi:glucose 1-dehydrogenase